VIKALSAPRDDGRRSLILGLSDENWRRMRAGEPIAVRLQDLDPDLPPMTVLLIGGATEEEMYEDLRARVPIRVTHGTPAGGSTP
jgi:hypothetical protein